MRVGKINVWPDLTIFFLLGHLSQILLSPMQITFALLWVSLMSDPVAWILAPIANVGSHFPSYVKTLWLL